MTKPIAVYIDYKSPYAYLAKDLAYELERDYDVALDWRPYVLDIPSYLGEAKVDEQGRVLSESRNPHQWRRVRYSYMDCRRYGALRGLVIRGPRKIFDSSIAAAGMIYALDRGADLFRRYSDMVFERFWKRELDIEQPERIASVLAEAGADAAGFAGWLEGPGRARLAAVMEEAHRLGVFGVPTFLLDGEVFWGREHLDFIRSRLTPRPAAAAPRPAAAAPRPAVPGGGPAARPAETAAAHASSYLPVRQDWLDRWQEEILEPELPIVDPHHHLWDRPGWRYLLDEFLADLNSGHRVTATVFVQCRAMYRADGPEALRPVGETEFVNGVAAMSASGIYGPARICAGIVGHADLRLGARVQDVLEAHLAAGGGRFRGIRHITAWDEDASLMNPAYSPPPGLLADSTFREGFARLAPLGLSFDAWLYFPQIDELAALARAFPDAPIVLNHVGGPLHIGAYAGRREEVFGRWAAAIRRLAACPNVHVKLGGLGMRIGGFGFHERPAPPSSEALADAWRPYVETCVEAFGAARCMFESNFPVDKGSYGYAAFWNACKRLAQGASAAEKADLFHGAAARFYRLDSPA